MGWIKIRIQLLSWTKLKIIQDYSKNLREDSRYVRNFDWDPNPTILEKRKRKQMLKIQKAHRKG